MVIRHKIGKGVYQVVRDSSDTPELEMQLAAAKSDYEKYDSDFRNAPNLHERDIAFLMRRVAHNTILHCENTLALLRIA